MLQGFSWICTKNILIFENYDEVFVRSDPSNVRGTQTFTSVFINQG